MTEPRGRVSVKITSGEQHARHEKGAIMRAWRYVGPNKPLERQEIERPRPGPGEVVIRVQAAGVCHSDLHILEGIAPFPTPMTLGHEGAGVVEEVGPGVTGVRPGQLVAVYGPNSCGDCRFCRSGQENLCPAGPSVGLGIDGSYAEFVRCRARSAVPVPEGVTAAQAAVATDAVLTPYHALKAVGGLRAGELAVIVGLGGLGMNAVEIAHLLGAYVIAIDLIPAKLEQARAMGAHETVDGNDAAAVTALAQRLPDLVADFVGSDATARTAQQIVRPGGRVVLVGLAAATGTLMIFRYGANQIATLGSFWGASRELAEILDHIARGAIRPIVATEPLDTVNDVLERLRRGQVEGRIALTP
jgi:propanol-preferring alcohol dehydrogenase